MSSSFASAVATPRPMPPDATKHVNYTLGMLLGVDDFNQDFAYLSGRTRWQAREFLGYGTTSGLDVTIDKDVRGPRVLVTGGSATTPSGCMICVEPAQCAYLNDWLAANQTTVAGLTLSPPGVLPLYLVLCYRSCLVDPVAIPGEPCRSEQDLTAPSRIEDDFRLELRVEAPKQPEESGIREFARWLDQVEIVDVGPFHTLAEFVSALRASIPTKEFVKDNGLVMTFGSPLASIRCRRIDANAFLRAATRIWVTSIRPLIHHSCASEACCCGGLGTAPPPATDDCILLAQLTVPLVPSSPVGTFVVDDTQEVEVDESQRPIVVHLRMLQELWSRSGFWWK